MFIPVLSSLLELLLLLDVPLRHFTFIIEENNNYISVLKKESESKLIAIIMNVARISRKSAKKRRNKKFGECITPICYNATNMYSQC